MPYIEKGKRKKVKNGFFPEAGDLAYRLTDDIIEYLKQQNLKHRDSWKGSLKFTDYALAVGIIELVKLELWKRLIIPYEAQKKEINGDVYNDENKS